MQTPTTPHQSPPHPRHDPVPLCMAKKWLPVSHRHGCAIYAHQNLSPEQQGVVGGELMVSAIIKGTPQQCLAALDSSTCGNSILGPTTAVEVLSQSADGSSEVLCIHLAQPWSSSNTTTITTTTTSSSRKQARISRLLTRLCCRLLLRRRCAVVQQTTWQDPRGIHCLTFASLTQEQQQQQQQIPELQQHTSDNPTQKMRCGSSSAAGLNSHTPSNGRCCPETGPDSQHPQHQQQYQHQHRQQQQQLRHRGFSAPGSSSADKQQGVSQQVQLHACCHQHSNGDGSSNSTHCQPQQQQQQQPSHTFQHQHQQQQQQQQQPASGVHLLLQPLYLLLSWLGSLLSLLASLLGLASSSSSSSGRPCWGLLGPVHVSVVGGFTVAGLGSGADSGGDNGGCVSETLVTSILKVDLGGCLAWSGSSGGCSLLHSAAVRLGVVDALVGQMLSAVERVKAAVEHPTPAPPQQQQQQDRARPVQAHSPGVLQGLASSISAVVRSALAPLTAWQVQRPQQQRQHSGLHRHQQQPPHQPQTAARVSSSSSSSQGGTSEGCSAAAAGVSSRGPEALVSDLVGIDKQGRPLTGFCNPAYWSPLHQPGYPALFQVRGPHYLADRAKVSAGDSAYALLAVDLVSTPTAVHHLARFLPSVRRCRAASAFVINMMVPAATDVMNLVMTFGSSRPWPAQHSSSHDSSTGMHGSSSGGGSSGERSDGGGSNGSSSSSSGSASDSGFQNALHRFLQADDKERSNMFKMIPHIEVGPWVLQGMVGTTPVIMGRKLETTYFSTDRYVEVDIDVTTCRTAGFIVQSIRGATTSLVVDLCYLLEGHSPQELPEQLIGAVRFSNIDMAATTPLDLSSEIPSWPQPW